MLINHLTAAFGDVKNFFNSSIVRKYKNNVVNILYFDVSSAVIILEFDKMPTDLSTPKRNL